MTDLNVTTNVLSIAVNRVLKPTGEVMTPDPVSISADTPLPEAARIMHDKKIHRLAVVDENHHPIEIITKSDLVRAIEDRNRSHHLERDSGS